LKETGHGKKSTDDSVINTVLERGHGNKGADEEGFPVLPDGGHSAAPCEHASIVGSPNHFGE
jgi:hypothetical protein